MNRLQGYCDKSIYSSITHSDDTASCAEVLLQLATDSHLTADGCDLICRPLPAAQPRLHNFIASFGKLITVPSPRWRLKRQRGAKVAPSLK